MAGYIVEPMQELRTDAGKLNGSALNTSATETALPRMTNFDCVTEEFMKNFGQKVFDTPQMDIFDQDPKTVNLRYKLIEEEVQELVDALAAKDMVETVDALGDILYVVYGAGGAFGINLDQAFDLIHKSNMTKLCKTEEEAKETVEWYKQHRTGPDGKYPYDTPAYRLSPDGRYYVPFNESTGKILKSINYAPVKFDSILRSGSTELLDSSVDRSVDSADASELSNFKKVTEEFMKNMGQKVFDTPQMDIFTKDPKTVNLRLKLIEEEVRELAVAMKEKDMVETIDALGDILYVVYGAGGAFGIDLDQAFDLIHKSNMTKLCKTEALAKETVEWYKKNQTGPEGKYPYDTPAYRLSPDGQYYVPFNSSTGKILKSVNYSVVKFDSILGSTCTPVSKSLTNFGCVTEEFMKNFGQKVFSAPQMGIFDSDPKTVNLRLKLIEEEVRELADALKESDMVETVDALGDILYVVYGAGGAFGVDLDKAFDLIHKSNMTKLCKTEEEAKLTVEWYKKNQTGPEGKYPYDTPAYRLSPDGKYFVPFNESTGKILKSINYCPVKFDSILPGTMDTSAVSTDASALSNFKKVTEEFMKNMGQKVCDTPQMDIFTKDPKTVNLRLKLIEEEVRELAVAMKEKDMVETIDALGDILYVVYGAGGAFGVDLDQAFDLIHKSNMTKLCNTEALAMETVGWYKKNQTGPEGKYPYDTPAYRLSPDGKYYVPFNASTGKILKSVNYSAVKFDSILPSK